jgi:hypothetical protein
MELHLKSFPLVPLIDDVAKTIGPVATKNGNRIVIACRPEFRSGSILRNLTHFRVWRSV